MDQIGGNSVQGTLVKLNVSMTPLDNHHMENIEWEAMVFVKGNNRQQVIKKEKAKRVDADNYIIVVDSSIVGSGEYYITFTAYIPDADVEGGVRIEKKTGYTGVTIDAR